MNEIDLAHVTQRFPVIGMFSGFVGAALWQLVMGSMSVLADRLQARVDRRQRIAAARARVPDR